jgi:hypothetical protein
MSASGGTGKQAATPVALLVDCAGGREFEVVHRLLAGPLRTPTLLLRRADLSSSAMTLDVSAGVLEVAGRRVRPAVAWIRHSSGGALLAGARPAEAMTPLRAGAWSAFLRQVGATAQAVLPGNDLTGPGQLADAARLGVRTPRTLVTNDVSAGVGLLGTPQVIVKTQDFRLLEPDRAAWPELLPAVVEGRGAATASAPGTAAEAPAAPGHPVVVQEYLPDARELRVYHLDGGVCAFEVEKPSPASPWTDPGSVTVTRTDCPPAAAAVVAALCAAWRLRYGAFDLLVGGSGEPVFLEANPDGDWLWFERRARWHGVSFMAAVMVRELFIRSTSVGVKS